MNNPVSIPAIVPTTQHVRVRITQRDLDATRKSTINTDRTSPVCRAINRVLRNGYEATFDGMSVGILTTKDAQGAKISVPSWEVGNNVYTEWDGQGAYAFAAYRVMDGASSPFFRGVSEAAKAAHRMTRGHRKTSPVRFTVSLPSFVLKRNPDVSCSADETDDDEIIGA